MVGTLNKKHAYTLKALALAGDFKLPKCSLIAFKDILYLLPSLEII